MPRLAAHLQRESHVEKYFKEQCEAHGAMVKKFVPVHAAASGFPDRLVYWFDGCHDVVELKRPKGGKYEPLQLSTHRKLRQRGHSVFVLNTKELVDAYIRVRRAYWNEYILSGRIPEPSGKVSLRQARGKDDSRKRPALEQRPSPRIPK